MSETIRLLRSAALRAIFFIPGAVVLILSALLLFWFNNSHGKTLYLRLPGEDDPQNLRSLSKAYRPPKGELKTGSGKASDIKEAWPMFRGANRDGINKEAIKLARHWPKSGPPILWSLNLGEGYASAAVRHGMVYVFDYDETQKRDSLRCLSLDDGREIWNYSYPIAIKRNHGISRTIPAVSEKYVVALGPKCHVICNDALSGELKWMIDLKHTYGTTEPLWYAGQCPIIDGENVILAPGGPDVLITAINCATGKPVWSTPNPGGWKMSHSSIMPMTYRGKATYIYAALGGVIGIDADNGKTIWSTEEFTAHTVSPSPVPVNENHIIVTAGYGKGGGIIELNNLDGKTVASLIKSTKPREFGAEQQTPILYNGHIYAVLPKPRQELVCMDLELNEIWSSGPGNTFGLGPYMIADGMIFLMDDNGLLTIAEATPEGYHQLAQTQVLHGHDSWGPMALVKGRLFVRDMQRMLCLDVTAKE